jgi:hypothetical protein
MGITHRRAVFILYGFSLAGTVAAIAVSIGRQWQAGVAILAAAAGMLGIVRFVGYFEHLHIVRRQRARIRTAHTEALRRLIPRLPAALAAARTEDDVFRIFDLHLAEADILSCEIVRRDHDEADRHWRSPKFSESRLGDSVSARFPLAERGSHDARFRWISEYGEVSPQTEILLQLAVDIVGTALERARSQYVPVAATAPAQGREFALAQRTESM